MPEAVPGHPQPQPLIVRGMHFEVRTTTGQEVMASGSAANLEYTPHDGVPSLPLPATALQTHSVKESQHR